MSDARVRNFLQRKPHPNRIRTDSGEVILLQGRNKWNEAQSAIDALDPATLEALDKDGNIIRSLQCDGGGGAGGREVRIEDQLTALARIMSESNDKAAQRHENAYKSAFDALLALTQTVSARLASMERAYMALVHRHAETIEQIAAGEDDGGLEGVATQFLLGRMSMGPPDTKPNGQKPKGDKPKGE